MVNNMTPLIHLNNICKGFTGKTERLEILRDVNFTIQRGETVAIVGASGIGKSTLLHILGTLDRPDKGELLFEETNLFSLEPDEIAGFRNRKIGFVFQFHNLLQGFTAVENVMIPCMINQVSQTETLVRSTAILERVGLKDRLDFRVEELSGGEQQRVALARALVLKPVLLLADEPTGNLDRDNSDGVHGLLMELNKEFDMTVIVVTHNNSLANLMNKKVTIKDRKLVSLT